MAIPLLILNILFFSLKRFLIDKQTSKVCLKSVEGSFTKFELPVNKPKAKE